MTETAKRRGRPPAYDPDAALSQARDVFWDKGFTGTSLDDLSLAMSMNRPSLYGAFGDKEALYLKTLARYRADSDQLIAQRLTPDIPLREGLAKVLSTALDSYLGGTGAGRGCLLIGTAAVEAVDRPQIRQALQASLNGFEKAFEARFRTAEAAGEIDDALPAIARAQMLSAVLHSLAVRARAGDTRKTLDAIARTGIRMICGEAPKKGKRA